MKIRKIYLFAFICLFVNTISAQKTWEKPYQKWSQDDVTKILSNSPWVKEYQSNEALTKMQQQDNSKETDDLRIGGRTGGSSGSDAKSIGRDVSIPIITIRLHSALPIRQAFVRLQQIGSGYDKMDQKKRAEFDESRKNTLECPLCQKFYILTMNKSVNSSGQSVEDGLFQTMNFEQLKGNIWLVNEKGEKLELAQFIPPKGSKDLAFLFFPRVNNFLTPENENFKVVFNNDFLTTRNPYAKMLPPNFEFKVSSLIISGNIAF